MSSKGKFHFSKEEEDKLIHEVSMHPVLYNVKHKLYRNQTLRDNIWLKIARNINKSVVECKTRWKNLKDCYWRRKRELNQHIGPFDTACKYDSKWDHMQALNFLDHKSSGITVKKVSVKEEPSDTTIETNSHIHTDHTYSQPTPLFTHIKSEPTEDMDTNIDQDVLGQETSIVQEDLDTNIDEGPPAKRKRSSNEELFEEINKNEKDRQRIFKNMEEYLSVSIRQHPIKTFFDSIADTVLSFPPAYARRAKKEVLDVVSRLEMELELGSINSSPDAGTNYEGMRDNGRMPPPLIFFPQ